MHQKKIGKSPSVAWGPKPLYLRRLRLCQPQNLYGFAKKTSGKNFLLLDLCQKASRKNLAPS